jgi:hypothetical protein
MSPERTQAERRPYRAPRLVALAVSTRRAALANQWGSKPGTLCTSHRHDYATGTPIDPCYMAP